MSAHVPGLPADKSRTAIGFSADGTPWLIRWLTDPRGVISASWVAIGFELEPSSTPFRATEMRGDCADFIVAHAPIESAPQP